MFIAHNKDMPGSAGQLPRLRETLLQSREEVPMISYHLWNKPEARPVAIWNFGSQLRSSTGARSKSKAATRAWESEAMTLLEVRQ